MPAAPEAASGLGAAYRALERRFRRLSLIGEALRLLEWDRAVMMPRGGAATRV
jgi:carboxypeptidase Taq